MNNSNCVKLVELLCYLVKTCSSKNKNNKETIKWDKVKVAKKRRVAWKEGNNVKIRTPIMKKIAVLFICMSASSLKMRWNYLILKFQKLAQKNYQLSYFHCKVECNSFTKNVLNRRFLQQVFKIPLNTC